MIDKTGTPSKIVEKTDDSLDEIRERVAKKNDLIRCSNIKCGHLLGKKDNATIDIQHKKLVIIAEQVEKLVIKCPVCGTITKA